MIHRQSIIIIGAGAWGTALASLWGHAGHKVTLWARRAQLAQEIQVTRVNKIYLPHSILPDVVTVTNTTDAFKAADLYCMAVPVQQLRAQLQSLAPHFNAAAPLVLCSKGIETNTGVLVSQLAAAVVPHQMIGILSGPNLAPEVAQNLPAAATLAMPDQTLAQDWAQRLSTPNFRLYASNDVTGAAIGGALKNVMAIAAGIVAGAGLGDNARAALITRGLAELSRLGLALGAQPETLIGLSGLGDLMLTATSPASRNYSFGYELGIGHSVADILAARHSVTEGVATATAALQLAQSYNVELPICAAVVDVVAHGKKIPAVLAELMARPLKLE